MKLLFLTPLVGLLAACGTNTPTDRASLEKELSDSLTLLSQSADINGFCVALAGPDGVLYHRGFGRSDVARHLPYGDHTRQPIASISKTLVGLAVLKAQQLGKLQLDDPIAEHLPFAIINPNHAEVPITLRHLVTHTSSITDTDDYLHRTYILSDTADLQAHLSIDISPCRFSAPSAALPMETFLRRYLMKDSAYYSNSAFMDTKPGERFEYSNVGATLAALVVEKATGMSFDAFTQQHILDPLGMASSYWRMGPRSDIQMTQLYRTRTEHYPDYYCITYPDGGFVSTPADMAKYVAELIRGHRGEGTVLDKAGYAEYFREQLTAAHFVDRAKGPFTDEHNMGILMGFGSGTYFGHTGGDPGTFSMLFVDRSTGVGRYLIVNTDLEDFTHHIRIWELLGRYGEKLAAVE
ncbi:MAG TPA: serine hydrolase domain-containing protein [Flavobacteriales bacterium]